jgi:LysM repeat protein
MRKRSIGALCLTLLALAFSLSSPKGVSADSLAQETPSTPAEVIQAVNQLRIAHGLLPLNTHPVLMQVAQWEANGHTRPGGLTLGQWLLSLGYPLSGDLSLDGYRSENWIAADNAQQAIEMWLMDAPHTNTMLSPDRSDIGAAVAVGDQTYIVIETALQTNSGKMQYDAYPILTAIAQGGSANDPNNLVPQYIIPVVRSTARPSGDVIHKVQYGQSLWSIAVTYNTTIAQIRAWNNLGESTDIYEGQVLLVQRNATQPPPPTNTPLATVTPYYEISPTATISLSTPTVQAFSSDPNDGESGLPKASSPGIWAGVIVLIALVAGVAAARLNTTRSPK